MQSHAGYSRCGLGSDGTDRLVVLVRQEQALAKRHQEPPVLYGAKITGGGSGGQRWFILVLITCLLVALALKGTYICIQCLQAGLCWPIPTQKNQCLEDMCELLSSGH